MIRKLAPPWGRSSGAAAAFTMAWFHPEWYRRVISYSGTIVNQQWPFNPEMSGGAWDYDETLIPRASAKPLRIWMQLGDRDLYNPNVMRDDMHDWVIANHKMAAAPSCWMPVTATAKCGIRRYLRRSSGHGGAIADR
jgi:hypothetical protein